MTVDPDSATPMKVQLAAILRGRISSGELTGRIPSIRTLTQEYGVSHVTAESALAILREEGLIETVVGKGSFVR